MKQGIAAVLALLLIAGYASAQDSAAEAGRAAAQQILDGAGNTTYSRTGGRNQAGSFRVGDQEFDIADMAPGATKSNMDQARARRVENAHSLESEGIAEYNRTAKDESASGEAARALYDVSTSRIDANADVQWLLDSGALSNAVTESFADCKATVDVTHGDPIESGIYTSRSCTEGGGAGGGGAESTCNRAYVFSLQDRDGQIGEGGGGDCRHNPMDNSCTGGGLTLVARRVGRAECETSGCQQEWTCTAEGSFEVDGVLVDEAKFASLGLEPLFPGAPATCRAATARTLCPVCRETDAGGQADCTLVDVAAGEGSTCGELERNSACKEESAECILQDEETGACLVTDRRFTCKEPRTVQTTRVSLGNSCDIELQCADGTCDADPWKGDDATMGMQEAMARLAIIDTMITDMDYDEAALSGANGGQLTPEQQKAVDSVRMFKGEALSCQKGYAGLVDCCGETKTDAHELYWSIYQRVTKDQQAARLEAQGGTSAYQEWQNGNATLSSLSNPFTSLRDNVHGGGSGTAPEAVTMSIWQEFIARARAEIKPALSPSWVCKDSEFDLAIQREVDMCSYAGTYCSQRVLGACLKRRESYCCYNSPMSKALRASAEPGGVLRHGSAKRPDCDGLRVEDLDKVKWESIDFTRIAANMAEGGAFGKSEDPTQAATNYTGSGQSGAMAAGRQDLSTRSADRLGSFDADAVRRGIADDVASRDYRTQIDKQAGPARLGFASSTVSGTAGRPVVVTVMRRGSQGVASATVSVVGGSPETAGFLQETVYWGEGDVSDRHVRMLPPPGSRGQVLLELTVHEGSRGGHSAVRVYVE